MSTFIFSPRKKEPEGSLCRDFGLYLANIFIYCGAVSAIDSTHYQCANFDCRHRRQSKFLQHFRGDVFSPEVIPEIRHIFLEARVPPEVSSCLFIQEECQFFGEGVLLPPGDPFVSRIIICAEKLLREFFMVHFFTSLGMNVTPI